MRGSGAPDYVNNEYNGRSPACFAECAFNLFTEARCCYRVVSRLAGKIVGPVPLWISGWTLFVMDSKAELNENFDVTG